MSEALSPEGARQFDITPGPVPALHGPVCLLLGLRTLKKVNVYLFELLW